MKKYKEILFSKEILISAIELLILAIPSYGVWHLNTQKIDLTETINNLNNKLEVSEANLASTTIALKEQRMINNSFEDQIQEINSTVGNLDKLSKTDPQLLQKYSKIYFLNENYIPSKLTGIDTKYLFETNRLKQIHTDVLPHLNRMIEAARDDGMDLLVTSAYRSFTDQNSLKSNYKFTYGSGANKFSADQGYSEHQLGTTIDFTTPTTGTSFSAFEKTEAFQWLNKNAYKYGFILSYPKGNIYYQYEPWHWRFVSTSLSNTLFDEHKNFYDMDQREINKYLVHFFD